MSWASLLGSAVTLLIGTFLGLWLSEFVRRPRLRISGSGSGGSPYSVITATVSNDAGFIGITLGRTIIFGRPVLQHRRWGEVVERHPALCSAWITDRDNPDAGGVGLYFRTGDTPPYKYENQVKIAGGEYAHLCLLVVRGEDRRRYFIFAPDSDGQPVVPEEVDMFNGPRQFVVHLSYSNGHKVDKWLLKITKGLDGHLAYRLSRYGKKGELGGGSL